PTLFRSLFAFFPAHTPRSGRIEGSLSGTHAQTHGRGVRVFLLLFLSFYQLHTRKTASAYCLGRWPFCAPAAAPQKKKNARLHFSRSCATICVVSSWQSGGGQQNLPGCGRSGAGHGTSERAAAAKRGVLQAARRTRRPLPPRSAEANLCRARPLQRGERRRLRAPQFGWNRGAPACKKQRCFIPYGFLLDVAPFYLYFLGERNNYDEDHLQRRLRRRVPQGRRTARS